MASLNVLDDNTQINEVYFIDSEGDTYRIQKEVDDVVLDIEHCGGSSISILRKDLPKLIRLIEKAIEHNL